MPLLHTIHRVTIVTESVIQAKLLEKCLELGARGYTVTEAWGLDVGEVVQDPLAGHSRVRIELLVQPAVAERILDYLAAKVLPRHNVTTCVEEVNVLRPERF